MWEWYQQIFGLMQLLLAGIKKSIYITLHSSHSSVLISQKSTISASFYHYSFKSWLFELRFVMWSWYSWLKMDDTLCSSFLVLAKWLWVSVLSQVGHKEHHSDSLYSEDSGSQPCPKVAAEIFGYRTVWSTAEYVTFFFLSHPCALIHKTSVICFIDFQILSREGKEGLGDGPKMFLKGFLNINGNM